MNPSPDTQVVLHGYLGESANLPKNLCIMPLMSKDLSCSVQIISFVRSSQGKLVAVNTKLKNLRPHNPVALTDHIKNKDKSISHALIFKDNPSRTSRRLHYSNNFSSIPLLSIPWSFARTRQVLLAEPQLLVTRIPTS